MLTKVRVPPYRKGSMARMREQLARLKAAPAAPAAIDPLAREMLGKFLDYGRPVTIPALFDGLSPTWALDAADRLLAAGLVRVEAMRWSVTEAGRGAAG